MKTFTHSKPHRWNLFPLPLSQGSMRLKQHDLRGAMRQFSVGQVVTYIPDMFLRDAASGDYRVVAVMPDRDGDHMYRIKSPLEEHERVVKESLLVKSDGYLPQEVPKQSSRRRSITLPTLAGTVYFPACASLDDPADTDP